MKNKVLLLAAILTLGCAANSFAAFAWITPGSDGSATIPRGTSASLIIKPSANVVLGYDTIATGATYSLGTFHTTGTMSYGTSSTDTNIYRFDNAGAATPLANTIATATKVPDAPTDTNNQISWPAGWTASK